MMGSSIAASMQSHTCSSEGDSPAAASNASAAGAYAAPSSSLPLCGSGVGAWRIIVCVCVWDGGEARGRRGRSCARAATLEASAPRQRSPAAARTP